MRRLAEELLDPTTHNMRPFRALPILSLLLGALANPLDLRDTAPRGLEARQLGANVCYPLSTGGLIVNFCASQTGESTFLFYRSGHSVKVLVFLQCASVIPILALSPQFRPATLTQSTT